MSINNIGPFTKSHLDMCIKNNSIDDALYEKYGVKRSLRDLNGIGINAGITNVSLSKSFTTDEKGNRVPIVLVLKNVLISCYLAFCRMKRSFRTSNRF